MIINYAEEIKRKLYSDSHDPVYAVIYARVSTDNEGQKESCANQVALANKYAAMYPNIIIMGTYIDDGISGKNDFNRPQYSDMLKHIETGCIDLVITKAFSRLNRDEENSIHLKRFLMQYQTTVITLEDNHIHDFQDINSGIVDCLHFAIDAQYVIRQSINGKRTQELRMERKELTSKDISYGYKWDKNEKLILIDPKESETVICIFEDYVYRNGTPATIQRMLKGKGIKISERTISNIIQDERYIGKFYINKQSSTLGTGNQKSKRFKLPKEQWVLVERPDLRIIEDDLFAMAQRIHKARITIYEKSDKKATQARFQGMHKYAGKIFCPVCGKPYQHGYADRKSTIDIYKAKNHSDCSNPINRIYESELDDIISLALKQIFSQQYDICQTLEEILIDCIDSVPDTKNEIEKLKKQIATKERQIDTLIETLSEDGLTGIAKDKIKAKLNTITAEISALNTEITDKENTTIDSSYVTNKIAEIRTAISELRNFTELDRDRILNYIDRIELLPNGDIDITLRSGEVITIKSHFTPTPPDGGDGDDDYVGKLRKQGVRYSSPLSVLVIAKMFIFLCFHLISSVIIVTLFSFPHYHSNNNHFSFRIMKPQVPKISTCGSYILCQTSPIPPK